MDDKRWDLDVFHVNLSRHLELANHVRILRELDKLVECIKMLTMRV